MTNEVAELLNRAQTLRVEGATYYRELFIKNDTGKNGERYGMYSEGDEFAPLFSEAFLYNLLGKDDARSVLAIIRRLFVAAGVPDGMRTV